MPSAHDPPRPQGNQPSTARAALLEAVRTSLAEHTALTGEQLADDPAVRDAAAAVLGLEAPVTTEQVLPALTEVLEDARSGIGWIIDGRQFLPDQVTAATTVTLRVSEQLLAAGDVFDGPDVAPLAITGRSTFPLRAGGQARRTVPKWEDMTGPEAFRFVLPVAALPSGTAPGDLVALDWDGEQLALRLVDEPPQDTVESAAGALRASFEQVVADSELLDPGDPLEAQDLVAAARIDHQLFTAVLPPVTELAAAADLSTRGDHVATADHDWAAWSRRQRERGAATQLAAAHDLTAAQAATVLAVLDAVAREAAALPGSSDVRPVASDPVEPPVDEMGLPPLLAGFLDQDVVEAVAAAAAYDAPQLAPGLAVLATRLGRIARGRDQATTHHLAAVAAEATGDVEEAARRSALAVRADPEHPQAAALAARLASVQGRAAEALRHLQGAFDLDDDSPLVQLLRRHAEPGPTDAARNEPCPCGSGRKHKRCCAAANGWPLPTRTTWLHTKLRDHATGPLHIDDLAELAEVMAGGLARDVPDRRLEQLVGDPFTQELLLWEGGLLEEYLDAYGPLLPTDELDLARRWQDASLELWEVTAVRQGEGLTLRGLSRDDTVDVREHTLSRSAITGQAVLARVLEAVDHQAVHAVRTVGMQQRDHLLRAVLPDRPGALGWAAALAPRPVHDTGEDDEPFVHHTVRYALDVDHATATAGLEDLFGPAEDGEWTWVDDDQLLLVRGFVYLEDGELVAVTSSDQRRTELDTALRAAFGDALVEASATAESIDELGARLREAGVLPLPGEESEPPGHQPTSP